MPDTGEGPDIRIRRVGPRRFLWRVMESSRSDAPCLARGEATSLTEAVVASRDWLKQNGKEVPTSA